jgi:hypothetical protein
MATYAKGRRSLDRRIEREMQHGNRELVYIKEALAKIPVLQKAIKNLNSSNVTSKKNEIIKSLRNLDKELDRAKKDLPKTSARRAKIEVEQGKWKQLIAITQEELTAKNRHIIPRYKLIYSPYFDEYLETIRSLKEYLIADIALSQQFLVQQEALDKTA